MRTKAQLIERPGPRLSLSPPAALVRTLQPKCRNGKEGRRPKPERTTAFTLVEILIALGIFSIVLAAIYSSWTAILRGSKVGLEAAAAVQRARIASRTFEETLTSVQSFALNRGYYGFFCENGNEAILSFVSRLSPSFPRSGKFNGLDVRRVTFSLEQHDGTRELVLRQAPLLQEMDKDEQNFPLVLETNVREFKTEFWDTRLQDWVDEWKDNQTNLLPAMVKVTLKLASDAYSSQINDVTRIVSLPSVSVQPGWQMPRIQPGPGQGNPGTPGNPAIPGNPGTPPLSPGFTPGFPPGAGAPGIRP